MKTLEKQPIIYVTRDMERALGLPLDTKGNFIISNFTPFAKSATKGKKNVLLIKEKKSLDTWELLQNNHVKKYINKQGNPNIIVFKNTLQIEKLCQENNWKLLNPPAELSNKVEEKISQIKWLGPLKKYLPEYKVLKCKNIKLKTTKISNNHFFRREDACESGAGLLPQQEKNDYLKFKLPFILQFNHSHTGSGTILINSEKILENIKNKFPEREARIAEYIPGPLFTNNNVVTKNKILLGNISYQITGLKPFTDLPFATIGNDWTLPRKILSKKQITRYKKIATDVGLRLKKAGWRGLFGIDVVVNEKNGKLYLVEINCRQPASAAYESSLQVNKYASEQVTTFETHIMALLDMDLKNKKLIEITSGAQIIQRVNQSAIKNLRSKINKLSKQFNVIEYNNTEPNSDLLRIQSKTGIMKKHNEFNGIGKKIVKILKN